MRKKINNAIKEAFCAAFPDYTYNNDFVVYANQSVSLPCVWQSPITLIAKKGRKEGVVTYRAEVFILEQKENKTSAYKESRWGEIEIAATIALSEIFSHEDIVDISNIKCAPDELATTGYQTLSMVVTFEITANYYEC